jgi:hypothetical protein
MSKIKMLMLLLIGGPIGVYGEVASTTTVDSTLTLEQHEAAESKFFGLTELGNGIVTIGRAIQRLKESGKI